MTHVSHETQSAGLCPWHSSTTPVGSSSAQLPHCPPSATPHHQAQYKVNHTYSCSAQRVCTQGSTNIHRLNTAVLGVFYSTSPSPHSLGPHLLVQLGVNPNVRSAHLLLCELPDSCNGPRGASFEPTAQGDTHNAPEHMRVVCA